MVGTLIYNSLLFCLLLRQFKSTRNIFVAIEMVVTVNVYIPSLLGILF